MRPKNPKKMTRSAPDRASLKGKGNRQTGRSRKASIRQSPLYHCCPAAPWQSLHPHGFGPARSPARSLWGCAETCLVLVPVFIVPIAEIHWLGIFGKNRRERHLRAFKVDPH